MSYYLMIDHLYLWKQFAAQVFFHCCYSLISEARINYNYNSIEDAPRRNDDNERRTSTISRTGLAGNEKDEGKSRCGIQRRQEERTDVGVP